MRSLVFPGHTNPSCCLPALRFEKLRSKRRKRAISLFVLLIAGVIWFLPLAARAQGEAAASRSAPVNPKASPEARALLAFFYEIDGKFTLTGQHNTPSQINYWSQRAYDLTGKYPAIFGQDLGFSGGSDKDSVLARAAMLEEIKLQHQRGAIITLTWHAVCPTDDEPVTFRESVQRKLSDFEWEEVITPGTRLHERWRVQIDEIAGFLRQLRDAHIPVLWRPYHEVHGGWFWWGGRVGPRGSAELYRQMYDRYVNHHQLDNLVWVWNGGPPNEKDPQGTNYYPGSEYADLVTIDVYGGFPQQAYDQLLNVAGGKPIALGEVGVIPTAEVLRSQPRWTYFLIWSEFIDFSNPLTPLKAVFDDPRQLSRGDAKLAEPMAALRSLRAPSGGSLPVTPGASEPAKALLAQLYAVSGKQVLSGYDFGSGGQSSATTVSFAETFQRRPAIFAADLTAQRTGTGTPEAALKALVDDSTKEAKAGAIISLSWKAPRPTDPDTAAPDQSARAALSDFEWRELLTPGTRLHERWLVQVDRVAGALKAHQAAGVPVLWRPYPEMNVKKYWWGGRKGANGGPALYRQLFDRLTVHHGLNNLVWVWTASPETSAEVPGAAYHDSMPGHLYFDAIAVSLDPTTPQGRRRAPLDRVFGRAGGGKPVGIEAPAEFLRPEMFVREPGLTWFVVTASAPASVPTAASPNAVAGSTPTPLPGADPTGPGRASTPADPVASLRAVLGAPQVISLPAKTGTP